MDGYPPLLRADQGPLMHLFMHHGHGGDGQRDADQCRGAETAGSEGRRASTRA
ncbi:DUF2933 domain-containing protein [Roseomonas chloroacetimidivorans]|uniref:DUF2933 domain-containing protein n=1 Tax=Roseomonas chloroacetimidivorans TaxID=1766656 RepID=UPI003C762B32